MALAALAAVTAMAPGPASAAGTCTVRSVRPMRAGTLVPGRLALSGDGRTVAYVSTASPTGHNPDRSRELFVADVATGATTQVTDGTTDTDILWPSLSDDGTLVTYVAVGAAWQQYLEDPAPGDEPVLVASLAPHFAQPGVISGDGTVVAYATDTPTSGDFTRDLLLFDVAEGTTTTLNLVRGPSQLSALTVSDDGARVAFSARWDPLGSNPGHTDEVFVYETAAGDLRQVTTSPAGAGRGGGRDPALSGDGAWVAYTSNRNEGGGNPDGNREVVLRELDGPRVVQVSHTPRRPDDRALGLPRVDEGGRRVAFGSTADVVPGGNPDHGYEVYLGRRDAGPVQVTRGRSDGPGYLVALDDAGRLVAFQSTRPFGAANPDGSREVFVATC